MWTYQQSTGQLSKDGAYVDTGYAGHGEGLNNPGAQNEKNVGPVPQGIYTIGPVKTPIDHLGPLAMPLIPDATDQEFGRGGFFIHGDSAAMNHTASDGCIILQRATRIQINASDDRRLTVIA